jgi:hypothetical protein
METLTIDAKRRSARPRSRALACPAVALLLGAARDAEGSNRRFLYNYEATTMPAGGREFETWVTWKTDKPGDPDFERFDIRHEFEFGLTDRLQLGLYLPDWRYEESATESGKADFRDVAAEVIYGICDPQDSVLGAALYGEAKFGDDYLEFETKLLLQKNLGAWCFVYNLGAEAVWEHDYDDDEGELMQSFGVSHEFSPSLAAGLEVVHEVAVPDWEDFGEQTVYGGPNLIWRKGDFWVGVAALWQLTDVAGEPDFQLRTIFALHF